MHVLHVDVLLHWMQFCTEHGKQDVFKLLREYPAAQFEQYPRLVQLIQFCMHGLQTPNETVWLSRLSTGLADKKYPI